MAVKIARCPAIVHEATVDVEQMSANSVTLQSVTVPMSEPSMFFLCKPSAALPAAVALGQPYCVTAGTVVVPVINAGGATPDPDSMTFTIIAL